MSPFRLSGLVAAMSVAACAAPQQLPSQSAVFIPEVEAKALLANEPADLPWANNVEQRLASVLAGRLPDSFVPEIECRSTMCGVGFRLHRGSHIKGELGTELAESIGLAQSRAYSRNLPDDTKVVVFYLMP